MERAKKRWLLFVALLFAFSTAASLGSLFYPFLPPSKVFSTASALAGLTALLQLDVAGFFERLFDAYSDEEEFPYGPPSHVTREISEIGNPDEPLKSWMRSQLFTEPRLGYWLAIVSLALAVAGTWL